VLDRESTFAHPEIVALLKTKLVPVAIDQAYQRRQQDTEGDFYRKIAGQSPRSNFQSTTQGFYIATSNGHLLVYNNNRDPEKLVRLMRQALVDFESRAPAQEHQQQPAKQLKAGKVDERFNPQPPADGLVLRVRAKVLGGYEATDDRWQSIFQHAVSRDNLWVTAEEHDALVRGEIPRGLQRRMARFHLVDNTRGEPPMWEPAEIRDLHMEITDGQIRGSVRLETARGDRGYSAELYGVLDSHAGRVLRLDLVALGDFWGEGPFTRNAPQGKFPLAIAFTLADGTDVADAIPPQGSRGWVDGYLRTNAAGD
jgi:hypothetical protein